MNSITMGCLSHVVYTLIYTWYSCFITSVHIILSSIIIRKLFLYVIFIHLYRISFFNVSYFSLYTSKYTMTLYFQFKCIKSTFAAISQRHHSVYYDHIVDQRQDIITDIKTFFYHMISSKFPCTNCKYILWLVVINLREIRMDNLETQATWITRHRTNGKKPKNTA